MAFWTCTCTAKLYMCHSIHCTVRCVQCTVYTVHVQCTVRCILCSTCKCAQCTLCIMHAHVQCTRCILCTTHVQCMYSALYSTYAALYSARCTYALYIVGSTVYTCTAHVQCTLCNAPCIVHCTVVAFAFGHTELVLSPSKKITFFEGRILSSLKVLQ